MAGCIFDGVSPTTRAHIFREAWIRDLASGYDVLRHVLTRHEPGDEFGREWFKERADFKVKCVCNGCNSGWMNDLDHAAEDVFVTDAVKGRSAKLTSPSDKLTVAQWCVLVAMIPFASAKTDTLVRRHMQGGILRSGGVLRQVSPDLMTPLVWPSPEPLDWADMAEFTRSFQTLGPLT